MKVVGGVVTPAVAPQITTTPAPVFTQGTAANYEMSQHVVFDIKSLANYSLSGSLPAGTALDSNTGTLSYDGIGAASVSSHQLTVTDAAGSDQGASFDIDIQAVGNAYWQSDFGSQGACVGESACAIYNDGNLDIGAGSGNDGEAKVNFQETSVLAAANHSAGGGTMGHRQTWGPQKDAGTNPSRFNFPEGERPNEVWIRWYMRYEAGFSYGDDNAPNYDKWLYCHYRPRNIANTPWIIPEPSQGGFIVATSGGFDEIRDNTTKFSDVFGNPSNGNWHCIEVHIKIDTDGTDGELHFWIDDTLRVGGTGLNITQDGIDTPANVALWRNGMVYFDFNENHSAYSSGFYAVDIDDMVVYTTTPPNIHTATGLPYIGPI